jgi:tRNA A-37 threonylcarbamoyl transferase component Bud32
MACLEAHMTASADRIGQIIGNHRVISLIGQGGMGAVYLAEHTILGRRAAIKILLPELSHNPELVQRFFVEARATAQLRHPAFVEVFDSGTLPDGSAYLAMEHLTGETLGERLSHQKSLPLPEALGLAREIAAGVGHAHRHGIVHRDLKPDNVFLATGGEGGGLRIKVLDFGIAKLTADPNASGGSRTRTGMILGTPLFMAPEQCRGAGSVALDQRVDVYALGCILHLMLAGEPPFPLEGFGEIISAHLSTPPPPLRSRAPGVPPTVEALVLRMLAKRPEDRPASMEALIAELDPLMAKGGTVVLEAAPAPPAVFLGKTAKLPTATEPARPTSGGPTTFTSAASMLEAPALERSPGRARWIAGGAVVAAGLVAALLVGGRHETPRKPPAVAAPAPVVVPPESVKPAVPPPPVPALVTLAIDSTPAGAEVVDEAGTVLGSTPYRGRYPAGDGAARLSLQKDGFHPRKVTLTLERDQAVTVTLEKLRPARPAPHRPVAPPPKSKDDDNDRRKL